MAVVSSAYFSLCPISGGFFLGILFDPDDGGDMVLRNIGPSLKYTVLTAEKTPRSLIVTQHGFSVYLIFIIASHAKLSGV